MPQRIQMKRLKGWRKPADTIYVGRPTRWGNPYRTDVDATAALCVARFKERCRGMKAEAPDSFEAWIAPLRGHDLACWCRPGAPCHADVLLSLASAVEFTV